MARQAMVFPYLAVLIATLPNPSNAQQPSWTDAKLQVQALTAGLEPVFRALVERRVGPAWIGYAVPLASDGGTMCCWHSDARFETSTGCGVCRLEAGRVASASEWGGKGGRRPPLFELEAPTRFAVLLRVEQRRVGKIRTFSLDCELDAGGLPVTWLEGVRAPESIALLSSLIAAGALASTSERLVNAAIAAIAMHRDPAADQALEHFLAPDQSEKLRKQALFWLGSARGRRGFELASEIARTDPSDALREQAVFALSLSKQPRAVDQMIAVARGDRSSKVRGQALFWLSQQASEKAVGAIQRAIESDPETQVKEQAVFGLSQLPPDRGVPLLIEVARANQNPAVRKKAIFWLGQSEDPRALEFFEQILLH